MTDQTDQTDELTILRTMIPAPPERHLPSGRHAERRRALLDEVFPLESEGRAARPVRPGPRAPGRRWRRRLALAALVPAALVGGAIAYSAAAHRTAEQLGNQATCFSAPSLDAPAAGSPFTGQDLGAFCRRQWSSGSITWPPRGPAPARWIACADAAGVDVFPRTDPGLCDRLGLQPLPPGYYEEVPRYSALEAEAFGRFSDSGCVTAQRARPILRRILDRHGYASWRVDERRFTGTTPCARVDLDPVNGVAVLVGWVRPELETAVRHGLEATRYCGPERRILANVRGALVAAGLGDWRVSIDHALTAKWPCLAGSRVEPATKSVVLTGYATR